MKKPMLMAVIIVLRSVIMSFASTALKRANENLSVCVMVFIFLCC